MSAARDLRIGFAATCSRPWKAGNMQERHRAAAPGTALRRRPTSGYGRRSVSAQATGRRRSPITKGRGNLRAWATDFGRGHRRTRARTTGVREARPLCPGVASGGAGKPGDVLCGHRTRVGDRTAGVRASGVCRLPRLQRHATGLRTPCVRRLRTASPGRLYLRRSKFLSHLPRPSDEPDHAQPARARRALIGVP